MADMKRIHFRVVQFIKEAGIKLHMKSLPVATAAIIYHTVFTEASEKESEHDPYMIGAASLYLAGKVEEVHLRLRDVINVTYRVLHKEKPPLEIGTVYWALRDSVTQCELYILRMLKFQVSFVHPHKFLLHYLKSLIDWLDPVTAKQMPLARMSWSILNDSYHSDMCIRYGAEKLAVASLYLALQCLGIDVPYNNLARTPWWQVFSEDLSIERIHNIISEIVDTYELENTSSEQVDQS